MAYGETADGRVATFEETRSFATVAEEVGLDSSWVFDHLLFRFPPEPDEGPHEAWTTPAALAPVVPPVEPGAPAGRDPASIRRTVGVRLHPPGDGADDNEGTDAGPEGLADFFDELGSLGFADVIVWSLAKTPADLERIAEGRALHQARG